MREHSRSLNMQLIEWFKILVSGQPHFVIGGADNPYLLRWHVIPRNNWLNIYLHKFLRDDEDRALHDHPWWFISWILKGGYFELVPHPDGIGNKCIRRTAPSIAYRPAIHRHRVILFAPSGQKQACWMLIITGRKKRTWGFWCPKGFVPWYEFVDMEDSGKVGKGCD